MMTVRDIQFEEDGMTIELADGQRLSVPFAHYPRLQAATAEQRANWRSAGAGQGLHWPDVDEDLDLDRLKEALGAAGKAGT